LNRFIWNMRYPSARKVPGDKTTEEKLGGPLAPPGSYQVTLSVGGRSQTHAFKTVKDPRVAATQIDFEAQFDLLIKIRDKLSETHDAIVRLRGVRRQVDEWVRRSQGHSAADTVSDAAGLLDEKLAAIEDDLIQVAYRGARDRLNLPSKLNSKLAEISSVVASADFAPPKQAYEVYEDIAGRIDPRLDRLKAVVDEDVSSFVNLIHELDIPAIIPGTRP
jgi:hypothetical protein